MKDLKLLTFRLGNLFSPWFVCPLCSYHGPFKTARPNHPLRRRHALCPKCNASERQRVQWVVIHELSEPYAFRNKTLLHFAPEPLFYREFRKLFQQITTTDLEMPDVDVHADICRLPFPDASFDAAFISHVLEHVIADRRAMEEVRRVLRPGGLAIVEVPVLAEKTVEYDAPNPHEFGHVRAPGRNYYDRFSDLFAETKLITSRDIDLRYQPYAYCDWTGFPTLENPHRRPIPGIRHPIIIALYRI